jgi:hypothetical protein
LHIANQYANGCHFLGVSIGKLVLIWKLNSKPGFELPGLLRLEVILEIKNAVFVA